MRAIGWSIILIVAAAWTYYIISLSAVFAAFILISAFGVYVGILYISYANKNKNKDKKES